MQQRLVPRKDGGKRLRLLLRRVPQRHTQHAEARRDPHAKTCRHPDAEACRHPEAHGSADCDTGTQHTHCDG